MQNWFNFYLEQAYQQAYFTFDNIMLTTAFEKKQLRSILETLTFEEFCKQSEGWL
jgi:hypothetical protein